MCRVIRPRFFAEYNALVHNAASESLLKSKRQGLHEQIAQILDALPDLAEARPELLAHHYTEAGVASKAIGYWLAAGRRRDAGRSADREGSMPDIVSDILTWSRPVLASGVV